MYMYVTGQIYDPDSSSSRTFDFHVEGTEFESHSGIYLFLNPVKMVPT